MALLGGAPARNRPFARWPVFDAREKAALIEVLESGVWGGYHPKVRAFEEAFARYQGTPDAVAAANGTVTLEAALSAAGIGPGDEVIVPPITFIATATAVLRVGAVPVFADIGPDYNIDPTRIRQALTPQTKALLVVHFAGQPADMDAIGEIAREHNLLVIEDAAHAHGASWRGRKVANFGDIASFSFQQSKNLTAGEGGVLTGNNARLLAAARSICNQGRREGGAWYEHVRLGTNYRMTGWQAAILLVQLSRLDDQLARRRENACRLAEALAGRDFIQPPQPDSRVTGHSYYLYMLRLNRAKLHGISRDRFVEALAAEGIPGASGYPHPLYRNAVFDRYAHRRNECPEAERMCTDCFWVSHEIMLAEPEDLVDFVNAIDKVAGGAAEAGAPLPGGGDMMSRRDFGLGGTLLFSAASPPVEPIAGLPLAKLRDRFHQFLFDDYLPFVDRHVIDHQYGGFLCATTPQGVNVNTDKRIWFEGRGIWVYSFLYNEFGRDPKHLEVARKSIELVMKTRPEGDALWPVSIDREGRPIAPPDHEIYGDLFIAEGLAQYHRATGDQKWWNMAVEIVRKCVRIYDRPDYNPAIGQTYLGKGAQPFPGARIGGVWMVLVRCATQMLRIHQDAELEALATRCLDAVLEHHYNPRFGLVNELINHDLSRPNNEYEQFVYTGHAIETLWMCLDETIRRKDKQRFATIAAAFERHCEVAWDRVYGGLYCNLRNVDANDWVLNKVLFPQQEGLIGSLLLYEQTGSPWARDFYSRLFAYATDKFPLHRHGSPIWQVTGNRMVDYDPDLRRVENYHQPRFLMLNLLALERMIARSK